MNENNTETKPLEQIETEVIKKPADIDEFIGNKIKYTDVNACKQRIARIRQLFCEGHESEKEMKDIELYFGILINIILNNREAFDDAVKRMHGDISRFSL